MSYPMVIARDAYNRPLKRLLIGSGPRVAYLANPELEKAVECGESWPIGFPMECTYIFDEKAFFAMTQHLAKTGKIANELWAGLTPYRKGSGVFR